MVMESEGQRYSGASGCPRHAIMNALGFIEVVKSVQPSRTNSVSIIMRPRRAVYARCG